MDLHWTLWGSLTHHEDIITWKNFLHYWPLVRENHWPWVWTSCFACTLVHCDNKPHQRTGLNPLNTKPLPEPMLTSHQWSLVAFIWKQFHRKCSRYLSLIWVWKLLIWYLSGISQGPMSKPNSWSEIQSEAMLKIAFRWQSFNTLRPRQNGRRFADDVFKGIFLNENVWILIKISLKFVPKGPINNIPALVLIMAWRQPGDKPLSEPMLVRSLTHICVTRPQWVNIKFDTKFCNWHTNTNHWSWKWSNKYWCWSIELMGHCSLVNVVTILKL